MGGARLGAEHPPPPVPESGGWAPRPAPARGALLASAAGDRLRALGRARRALGRDLRSPGRLRRPSPRALVRTLVRALRGAGEASPLAVPIGSHPAVPSVPSCPQD